jgi:hypothetical protein
MSFRSCLLVVGLGAVLGAVFVFPTVMAIPAQCNQCACKDAKVVKAVPNGNPVGLRQNTPDGGTAAIWHAYPVRPRWSLTCDANPTTLHSQYDEYDYTTQPVCDVTLGMPPPAAGDLVNCPEGATYTKNGNRLQQILCSNPTGMD